MDASKLTISQSWVDQYTARGSAHGRVWHYDACLCDGPLSFVLDTVEHYGGRKKAVAAILDRVEGGLDLNFPWRREDKTGELWSGCPLPALHLACLADPAWAGVFKEAGADLDIQYRDNGYAVAFAALQGHAAAVDALLTAGASASKLNSFDHSILHEVSRCGHVHVLPVLLRFGCSVHASGKYGDKPMHLAAGFNHPEFCLRLMEAGADIEAVNTDLETPLMCAAMHGSRDAVIWLIQHGADPQRRCRNTLTPIEHAKREKHLELAREIEELLSAMSAHAIVSSGSDFGNLTPLL